MTTQKRAAALVGIMLVAAAGGVAGVQQVQAQRVEEALHTELHTHTARPDTGGLLFLANQVSRVTGQTATEQAAPAASALLTNWPLSHTDSPDVLNSYFGPRWRISQSAYEFHPGIDLAAPYGTSVYAGWGIPMVPGHEQATARLTPDGGLELRVGVHTHGQSMETTLAQVAHEMLGIDVAKAKLDCALLIENGPKRTR